MCATVSVEDNSNWSIVFSTRWRLITVFGFYAIDDKREVIICARGMILDIEAWIEIDLDPL